MQKEERIHEDGCASSDWGALAGGRLLACARAVSRLLRKPPPGRASSVGWLAKAGCEGRHENVRRGTAAEPALWRSVCARWPAAATLAVRGAEVRMSGEKWVEKPAANAC